MGHKTLENLVKAKLKKTDKIETLDLKGLQINVVERGDDASIVLRRNRKKEIKDLVEKCRLTRNQLENVKTIDLSYNNIEIFNFEILKELASLESLDLSHNLIEDIVLFEDFSSQPSEIFKELKVLKLYENKIKSFDNFDLKYFKNLQELRIDYANFEKLDDYKNFATNKHSSYKVNIYLLYLKKNQVKATMQTNIYHS